jgi:hypothetical protein
LGDTVQKEIADKNFRAFTVVIVGSRQILVREMDRRGNWVSDFQLCEMNTAANRSNLAGSESFDRFPVELADGHV